MNRRTLLAGFLSAIPLLFVRKVSAIAPPVSPPTPAIAGERTYYFPAGVIDVVAGLDLKAGQLVSVDRNGLAVPLSAEHPETFGIALEDTSGGFTRVSLCGRK